MIIKPWTKGPSTLKSTPPPSVNTCGIEPTDQEKSSPFISISCQIPILAITQIRFIKLYWLNVMITMFPKHNRFLRPFSTPVVISRLVIAGLSTRFKQINNTLHFLWLYTDMSEDDTVSKSINFAKLYSTDVSEKSCPKKCCS